MENKTHRIEEMENVLIEQAMRLADTSITTSLAERKLRAELVGALTDAAVKACQLRKMLEEAKA